MVGVEPVGGSRGGAEPRASGRRRCRAGRRAAVRSSAFAALRARASRAMISMSGVCWSRACSSTARSRGSALSSPSSASIAAWRQDARAAPSPPPDDSNQWSAARTASSAASRSPWARRTRPRWTRPRARRRSCRVVRPISMTRSSVVIASSISPACSRTRPSVSRCDAFGGGVPEALGGGGGLAEVGGGVVEAFFGLGDVAEEGVEVVEDPVVAEWSQEAVGVRAGGAGCDRVAEGERGVGGEDPGAAEVPRVGCRRGARRLSSRSATARSGPPFWISTSARADRLNTAR